MFETPSKKIFSNSEGNASELLKILKKYFLVVINDYQTMFSLNFLNHIARALCF